MLFRLVITYNLLATRAKPTLKPFLLHPTLCPFITTSKPATTTLKAALYLKKIDDYQENHQSFFLISTITLFQTRAFLSSIAYIFFMNEAYFCGLSFHSILYPLFDTKDGLEKGGIGEKGWIGKKINARPIHPPMCLVKHRRINGND